MTTQKVLDRAKRQTDIAYRAWKVAEREETKAVRLAMKEQRMKTKRESENFLLTC